MVQLNKIFKSILLIIIVLIPVIFIIINLLFIPESQDYEIEDPVIIQGEITDKKIISGRHFFTLNGSIDYQICSCIYYDFQIGEYIYLLDAITYSRDGENFVFIICDDFSYRLPYLNVFFYVFLLILGFYIVFVLMRVLVIFIKKIKENE